MKLTHLVIFISALFCHQLSAQIQNPDNCALSDYCASVGQYYKAQADIKSELVNTALTINYKTPTEKLIKIAWNTNKTYELVRSLEVLAIKGLNGTQIIHPESSGLINNLSGKDEYETWLFDEDNYSVDPDAKKIFTEMGYVLNDYTRWKIIKSSSNFDKLLPLFFSIPDKGIYKVITAWIERESKPTLAQKIITNFISDAIALGFMSMGIAPTDLFAEAPLMVRSTKGRIFKLEPKDPLGAGTPYRNNMDMPFGSSYRPKTPLSKDIESIFVLKELPKDVVPGNSFSFKGKNILIVEDNMTVATKFIEQIKKTGSNKIDHVTTGEDALELIESNKYDLIFMDYTLGDVMNGDQLTLIIRKADINTPIVSISNMDLGDAGPMILHRNGYNGQILKDNYIGLPDNVEKIVNFWIDKGLIREFN